MVHGTYGVPRVTEESVCRTTSDYTFTEVGLYKVHSTALMPNIPFEESSIQPYEIDSSIFINDDDTKLCLGNSIQCQNYLTTRFIGRAPLEWYDGDQKTKMGRQFVMICRNGNPNADNRVFGTEAAIKGYNRNANDNVKLPGGGD